MRRERKGVIYEENNRRADCGLALHYSGGLFTRTNGAKRRNVLSAGHFFVKRNCRIAQNSAADKESAEPAYSAPDIDIRDCNFIPVLIEDDIDYMGKPYRDLTAEEFIQLWAQSRREYNVQRLYVMSYDNTVNGEDEKSVIKEDMETILYMEYIGRMMCGYYDVELRELEDAP